ncbi:MAG: hypothetical protein KTR28_03445 [Micavibrio sp.]|nr:hypothetical protein [Micavibrio sp.]
MSIQNHSFSSGEPDSMSASAILLSKVQSAMEDALKTLRADNKLHVHFSVHAADMDDATLDPVVQMNLKSRNTELLPGDDLPDMFKRALRIEFSYGEPQHYSWQKDNNGNLMIDPNKPVDAEFDVAQRVALAERKVSLLFNQMSQPSGGKFTALAVVNHAVADYRDPELSDGEGLGVYYKADGIQSPDQLAKKLGKELMTLPNLGQSTVSSTDTQYMQRVCTAMRQIRPECLSM